MYKLNATVQSVPSSPIGESKRWLDGRSFPPQKPLLDVAQAVPGYPPPRELTDHLASLVGQPRMSLYTDIFGLPELRVALATAMSGKYRGVIDSEQVAITAGCNQGFCAAITALAQAGDEVILPLPYYFNHQMWLEMLGVKPVYIPFNAAGAAVPDPAAASELINPRTRAIALVTPNNPTGAVYPPAVIQAFYELARRHALALILDETYKDFIDAEEPAHALFQDANWPETLVQLYSFSKAYCLTGYRVGSIICAPRLLEEIAKFQDCVAICAPCIGQAAALYGLEHLEDWKVSNSHMMQGRARALAEAFRGNNALRYRLASAGAYFAYVQHPFRGESAAAVARRLVDEHNVLCLPGSNFGPEQEDYLRIAFANLEAEQIPELIERFIDSQNR